MGFYKILRWPRFGLSVSFIIVILVLVSFSGKTKLEPLGNARLWSPSSLDSISELLKSRDLSASYFSTGGSEFTQGVAIELPFFKVRDDRSKMTNLVYTLKINANTSPSDQANSPIELRSPEMGVLFMQIVNGGDFYLNGTWVGGLPRSSLMQRYVWYRPVLIPLPQNLLNENGRPNLLTVVQTTHEPFVFITRPYVGKMAELNLVYEATLFLTTILASASNLFCLIAGLFMLAAWATTPKDTSFALAGAVSVLWALLFILTLWQYMPMSLYKIWRWGLYVCEAGIISLLSIFVLSFAKSPFGFRASAALGIFSCIAPLVYAIGGMQTENLLNRLWLGPMLLVYLYANVRLGIYCLKTRNKSAIVLLGPALLSILLIIHDYCVLTGLLPEFFITAQTWSWPMLLFEPISLMHLGLTFLLLLMGKNNFWKNKRHIQRVLHTNNSLQESLLHREIEFAKRYETQAKLERIKATNTERERIYQDVHDGIGSRLVATLFSIREASATPTTIEAQLQTCLDDLRLVINTQLADSCAIQTTVFDYCLSLETQLEGSPLSIQYDVSDGPAIHLLPKVHLNVLRIFQEAVTNTIKHANASELLVVLEQTDTDITLSISDNGLGLIQAGKPDDPLAMPVKGGLGLPGLMTRARSFGGRCVVSDAAPGTLVQLWLPLINTTSGTVI